MADTEIKKYTLRLSEEDLTTLDNIIEKENISTRNAGMKFLINTFEGLQDRYLSEMRARKKAENELAELRLQLQSYFSTEEKIKKLISK